MFEWDEAKAAANLAKHGVDFFRAVQIFRGDYVESKDPRNQKENKWAEARWFAVGEARGRFYVIAFTWRGENRRIISAWAVGEKGYRRYQGLLMGRS